MKENEATSKIDWALYLQETRPDLWGQYKEVRAEVYKDLTDEIAALRRRNRSLSRRQEKYEDLIIEMTRYAREILRSQDAQ